MRASAPPASTAAVRLADVVLAVLLLGLFVLAYATAQDWPFRARIFPELVSEAGVTFAVLRLVGLAIQARRGHGHPAAREAVAPAGGQAHLDEDDGDDTPADHSLEYVFGTAGRREWSTALGWVSAFFFSIWLVGLTVTVPAFTVAYLRVAGRASWIAAGIYAGVLGGVIWLVLGYLLAVPLPTGVI